MKRSDISDVGVCSFSYSVILLTRSPLALRRHQRAVHALGGQLQPCYALQRRNVQDAAEEWWRRTGETTERAVHGVRNRRRQAEGSEREQGNDLACFFSLRTEGESPIEGRT